jgi:hypothetical protein
VADAVEKRTLTLGEYLRLLTVDFDEDARGVTVVVCMHAGGEARPIVRIESHSRITEPKQLIGLLGEVGRQIENTWRMACQHQTT